MRARTRRRRRVHAGGTRGRGEERLPRRGRSRSLRGSNLGSGHVSGRLRGPGDRLYGRRRGFFPREEKPKPQDEPQDAAAGVVHVHDEVGSHRRDHGAVRVVHRGGPGGGVAPEWVVHRRGAGNPG